MLRIFRRHLKACKHRGRYRRCQCPVHVDGTLGGRKLRKSLETRNWEQAAKRIQEWEAAKQVTAPSAVSTSAAWKAFFTDLEARALSPQTLRKYKLLERQMLAFAEARNLEQLAHFSLEQLTAFRSTWKDGARTAAKKLERLRAFSRFCFDRQWTDANHVAKLKGPKVTAAPTMPLEPAEMVKILAACDALLLEARPSAKLNAARLRTLILVMRYTGLRISDAVALTTDQLDGAKLFLRTAKTGVPVYTLLPDSVLLALEATPRVTNTRFFWSGQGDRESAVRSWQTRMKKVFDRAGVAKGLSNAVSHRLRDTFATELLLAGVPLERVAVLLGHQSVSITEKHYAPWVRSRQERLEADLAAAWRLDPSLADAKHTHDTRGAKGRPN